MLSPSTAARALRVVSAAYLIVGLIWVTAAMPSIDLPGRLLFDLLDWPLDGSPADLGRTARWSSAVGAGLLVGLALVTMLVVAPEIERGNARVVRGTVVALLAWFVVDSVGSFTSGVTSNVAWNVPFLLLWLLPLLLVRDALVTGTAGADETGGPTASYPRSNQ